MLFRLVLLLVLLPGISACSWWPWGNEQETAAGADKPVPPSPEEIRDAQLRDHLEHGQLALETDRLSLPANDCAVSHFRAALSIDPGNVQAQLGLRGVVSRYLQLSKVAHGNGDDKQAADWLKRAEEVNGPNARIDAVRTTLKKTPKGQDNREIEFLPATDYLLSRDDLDERGSAITQRLESIASRAAERDRAALVLARNQEEGEWVVKTLRQSVPAYPLKARIAITKKPAVILVPESKLEESQHLLGQKQDPAQVERARQTLQEKTDSYLKSEQGKQTETQLHHKSQQGERLK